MRARYAKCVQVGRSACVTVNCMRAALKVIAGYIPPADCVLNQTTKEKIKITNCS